MQFKNNDPYCAIKKTIALPRRSARARAENRIDKKPSKKLSKKPVKTANPQLKVWLQTRKKILQQIKNRVAEHLDREPKELVAYRREYERNFHKKFQLSDISELEKQIKNSQVVFGGDFHAFSQAQRMHLKIMRRYPADQEVTIALESTSPKQNEIVESYLNLKISEKNFLKKMQWSETWGFPWENYRPIFELARDRKYRIIGLSEHFEGETESLRARDKLAAQILVREIKRNPKRKIYVLFGDLHIADKHLPKEFSDQCEKLGVKAASLSIMLNSESIYFKLAEKRLENKIEIVKLSQSQFCVMGSPPWVQWQSYLMYLERSTDQMLLDEDPEFDPTDEVRALVELVCSDLKIQMPANDLAVYSSYDEKLWRALRKQVEKKDFKLLDELIEDGRSLCFSQSGICYLARPSVNHVAELAGQYLHAKLSKRKKFYWDLPNDFEKQIWCEALSFFISKLINHKRYSQSLLDLSQKLRENATASEQEILKLALDHRMGEVLFLHQMKKHKRRFKPRRKTSYLFAARILGSMMGERLYIALQSNKIKLGEIVRFLKFDPQRTDFLDFYLKILRWLEPVHLELKSRKERL